MELSERKQKILKAIVDLYIRTAEPVGSKTIIEARTMPAAYTAMQQYMMSPIPTNAVRSHRLLFGTKRPRIAAMMPV